MSDSNRVTSPAVPENLPIPENLAASVARNPVPDRLDWMARLPDTVTVLARRWELRLGPPFEPGGDCSWVAPARDARGRDAVLKVEWLHDEAEHEADGLRVWAGDGTALLYDSHRIGNTCALLLERCTPGTELRAVPEPEQDLVIAGLLARLWCAPTAGVFRPLRVMCEDWAKSFEARVASGRTPPVDPGLAREGIGLLRELPTTATRAVLLCTDLHAGNVLAATREPWLVVDPKPYVGDPTYDVLQHMLNCDKRLAADPVGLARRLAALTGLDLERVLQWMVARFVQESFDQPWLGGVAARVARVIG
jgi:streptomycin 6-kinase